MKIRILQSAFDDLDDGADFYERQGEGLGSYFMSSLISDIDSLRLYAGIHRVIRAPHVVETFPVRHLLQSRKQQGCRLRRS